MSELIDTWKVGFSTMVGSIGEYPRSFGNCFSLIDDEGREVRIVNFYLENLEELLRRKTIEWPVKVLKLSDSTGVIHDFRVSDEWYNEKWCETCCPRELLPINQRLKFDRKVGRGEIEVIEGDGIILYKTKITARKRTLNE